MILPLVMALAIQTADCNDSNYDEKHGEGLQADSVVPEPCSGGDLTVHIKFQADGSILIVEASVEGAVSITLRFPDSCIKFERWYSGAIHQCEGTLVGTHCDFQGSTVQVQLMSLPSACPDLELDILGFLTGITDLILGGQTVVNIPCKDLKDTTGDLSDDAKVRYTARLRKCKSKDQLVNLQDLILRVDGGSGHHVVIEGDPRTSNIAGLVPNGVTVTGNVAIEGFDHVFGHLNSGSVDNMPLVLQQAWSVNAPLAWIDDLSVTVRGGYHTWGSDGVPTWRPESRVLTSNFRQEGEYSISEPVTVFDGFENHQFMNHWFGWDGNVAFYEPSSLRGIVYPEGNGAAGHVRRSMLSHIDEIEQWVFNPFLLHTSAAATYTELPVSEDRVLITQRIAYGFDEGVASNELAHALFGSYQTYTVDTSGSTPRIINLERWTAAGGLIERQEYSAFRQVSPEHSRPGIVDITTFTREGEVDRHVKYEFFGRVDPTAEPRVLAPPKTASGLWSVLLSTR